MKKTLLFLFVIASFTATAQKQKKDKSKDFAASISAADLKKHLFVIAGKEMEGRETATEGQRKAAAYIENHFKSIGLIPGNNGSYQMYFPVYRDKNVRSGISVNNTSFISYNDFIGLELNHVATQFFSEVVLMGHGIVDSAYNDYDYTDVRGKLVLILDGKPASLQQKQRKSDGIYAKIKNAQLHGAAAVLIVSNLLPADKSKEVDDEMFVDLYRKSQLPNTYLISDKVAEKIIGADWENIRTKSLQEQVPAKLYKANIRLQYQKEIEELKSSNVLAVVEGSDLKDQYLFVTAHYDHLGKKDSLIYYGADDDGSGTVSVLEIAEAFAKAKAAGNGPRRTIVFMTVSGEEEGLWGSEYYSDNPVFPLNKTTADLNIDMIGRIDSDSKRKKSDASNYIYIVGDDKLSTDLKPISESINKKYTKLAFDYKYNDPQDPEKIYFRSDHYNFAKNGVPIIFYFDGIHEDYHQTTDTPDKINYTLLEKRARLIFYTAWEMANRDEMLKRDLALPEPGR